MTASRGDLQFNMGSKPQSGSGMFHFLKVLSLAVVKASVCEQKNGHIHRPDCGSNPETSEWKSSALPQNHQIPSSIQSKMHHILHYESNNTPTPGGLFPLSHSLLVDTSEQGIDPNLFSETVRISFENDRCPLLYDDFSWCDDSDRSLEEGCLSLSEDCEDLTCDVLRGHRWRHKLLAITRFWWSSCGNRPVTQHKGTWQGSNQTSSGNNMIRLTCSDTRIIFL
jgi:hypothetical protein